MLGSRIAGPVSQALRDVADVGIPGGRWAKILSLAPKVSAPPSVDRVYKLILIHRSCRVTSCIFCLPSTFPRPYAG